jgi:hypothetical protein
VAPIETLCETHPFLSPFLSYEKVTVAMWTLLIVIAVFFTRGNAHHLNLKIPVSFFPYVIP